MPMVEVECIECGSNNVEETYGVCNCLECGSSKVERVEKSDDVSFGETDNATRS